MKIKILKDIPGYKAGEIIDTSKVTVQTGCTWYDMNFLISIGFAEEIKDEDDPNNAQNTLRAVRRILEVPEYADIREVAIDRMIELNALGGKFDSKKDDIDIEDKIDIQEIKDMIKSLYEKVFRN